MYYFIFSINKNDYITFFKHGEMHLQIPFDFGGTESVMWSGTQLTLAAGNIK